MFGAPAHLHQEAVHDVRLGGDVRLDVDESPGAEGARAARGGAALHEVPEHLRPGDGMLALHGRASQAGWRRNPIQIFRKPGGG